MKLSVLERFDPKTANGILAAAALTSAPDPGIGERLAVLRSYEREADEVLSEIRGRLRIAPDNSSPAALASVSKVLADALQDSILRGTNTADVISRVGQAGRLPPTAYNVIQPTEFTGLFYDLGVSRTHVEDAVKHPDDHQHLMTEGVPQDWEHISLFMKRVISRNARKSHWLLVQAHRIGIDQRVIAAWQVYPGDVNLENARKPIDVLKAFVKVYGVPLSVGGKREIFFDLESFPANTDVTVDWTGAPNKHFMSFSRTTSARDGRLRLGVAYCIDLPRYVAALRARGVKVHDPPGPLAQTVTAITTASTGEPRD